MGEYNSKQKLYIGIAISIFIVINILALVFALPYLNKGSVKGIYTSNQVENVLVNGNLERVAPLDSNNQISNGDSALFIQNPEFTLAALPQSTLGVVNTNKINVTEGIFFLEASTEITLHKDIDITVSSKSRLIFDSNEGNIYVLKGSVTLLGLKTNAGYVTNINSKDLATNLIDKTQLLSTNKAKELNKLLLQKTQFIPEINYISKPELSIKDNIFEITTSDSKYKIEGEVSAQSHVYINSKEASVNEDGEFYLTVNLNSGINQFKVEVVDEVANTTSTNLNIILNY